MASPRPHTFNNQSYLPNGASGNSGPVAPSSTASPLLPNNGRVIQSGAVRILCVADVRGNLRSLNELAKQARADHIIHTGDFGFYDDTSLDRIAEKTLKHVAQYSPLLSENVKRQIQALGPQQQQPLKQRFPPDQLPLSELSAFISGKYTLDVPVYTVWGACEDVRVLEKFRSGEYKVDKLHIIDEASSRLLDVGGIKLRLLGLGGAVVMHKLFDNGEGRTTIAGGQGTMWTTLLQMGELVDTANRVYDPSETRVFVTHASPAREGLLNQLSVTLKADFSISAGLHFRYGSSYNEFSVNPTLDHYRGKLAASKASFNDVWETVKSEVEPAVQQNEAQQALLSNALDIVHKMPTVANGGNPFGGAVPGQGAAGQVDESAFKNMWNFNLADAAFGYLVLEIEAGRIGTEMRAQGFNFAHRGAGSKHGMQSTQSPAMTNATNQVPQVTPNLGPGPPSGPAQSRPMQQTPQSNQHLNNQTQQPNQPQRSQQQAPTPQQAQTKPPSVPSQAAPSPAPVASQVKPATPQPVNTTVNIPAAPTTEKSAPTPASQDARNGTAPEKNAAPSANKTSSPAVEKKPSTGLFIHNLENEDAVREIFPEEDKVNIVRVEKYGKSNHVVHFSNHEQAKAALERQPQEHKRGGGPLVAGQPRKPNVKWYDERGPRTQYPQRDNQGPSQAGQWQPSARGGANNSGGRGGPGYQSGASDSEGGRGRGGFSSRGGRGRGNDRGGRGGRGGKGYSKGSGGEETSTPTTPAPVASIPAATTEA
ncbi:MAG: hypothetical protein MMC33_006633 [Icmadophila ericetorum]|nr:hypothetical protein [Icmadophila ericetorum]